MAPPPPPPTSRAPSRADLYSLEKLEQESGSGVGSGGGAGLAPANSMAAAMMNEAAAEQALATLREALNRELKIKEGSENMLEALNSKNKARQTREQRQRVEAELASSVARIRELRKRIAEAQSRPSIQGQGQRFFGVGTGGAGAGTGLLMGPDGTPSTPPHGSGRGHRTDGLFGGLNGSVRSPPSASRSTTGVGSTYYDHDGDLTADGMTTTNAESPTFLLAEILQALEVEGLTPEYYISRANSLVDLFKRHPTLKYDLVWSVFGLRMQVMLLSESMEVVAAGYRMTRYAISDVSSLKKIRSLNTDYLVVLSLTKERKAEVEREQALKFVRAFLDVKDGVREISQAVVRTIATIAEHPEDRLRSICIETLAEILVRDPALLVASGGIQPLSEALADGSYKAPESLASAFLFLLDAPQRRKYLKSGLELELLFSAFTDPYQSTDNILKQNSKSIICALKSWPGLMALCMNDFRAIRSLVSSLVIPYPPARETIIDLVYTILRIKSPGWATSFLAGRRLTTYGRVANLKTPSTKKGPQQLEDEPGEQNFVDHYTALLLAVLIKCGLVPALLRVTQDADSPTLRRKTTLLISEVLKLASYLLPPSWSSELQLMPELFAAATAFDKAEHHVATGIVYQVSSVSKTLYRSAPSGPVSGIMPPNESANNLNTLMNDESQQQQQQQQQAAQQPKVNPAAIVDDATYRQMLIDSGVLSHSNVSKWNWDVILKIIEGPMTIGKRLEEAVKASKFVKRLVSFYLPQKYRFSTTKPTRNTQRYVRVGCALMHTLLQSVEGRRYLADSKLLKQIAENLAVWDPVSSSIHEKSHYQCFSRESLQETLSKGYFAMIGVLTADPRGLQLLDRWRIFNMIYHIFDLKQRPDMIRLLLSNFDYRLQGHPRVLLSKALTAGTKDIRIHATNVLRRYAIRPRSASATAPQSIGDAKWAIQLLVTQLYDPEVDVCATAVRILEKACNTKSYLEYIVECRPSLDHLGAIGAPLLLRFLSTSIGYHYLDGLDYISNEMDDWFLGRNDSYVGLIEASLGRAFSAWSGYTNADGDQSSSMPMSSHNHAHRRTSSIFAASGGLFGDEADYVDDDADETDYSLVPPHFYRELTRTREGCRLLAEKGHFDEFAATIREHGMQSDDPEMMVKVKGCMWAVGAVGSMELGAPFLEGSDVVECIVRIAQEHEVWSLRGTAFLVLGLVSRSVHGLEILAEHGWDANTTPLGRSLGYCIPNDLSRFFSCRPWKNEPASSIVLPPTQITVRDLPPLPDVPRDEDGRVIMPAILDENSAPALQSSSQPSLSASPFDSVTKTAADDAATTQYVMELVGDLGNMVLYRQAMRELQRLRRTRRDVVGFRDPALFRRVMATLERSHFRLPIRRALVELFDRSVLRDIVFGITEDGDDDDDSDSDGGGVGHGAADDDGDVNGAENGAAVATTRRHAATAPGAFPPPGPAGMNAAYNAGIGQAVAAAAAQRRESAGNENTNNSGNSNRMSVVPAVPTRSPQRQRTMQLPAPATQAF